MSCEPHQIAICVVIDGVARRECRDPSRSVASAFGTFIPPDSIRKENALTLVEWAAEVVIFPYSSRDIGRSLLETDLHVLLSGTFLGDNGEIIRFALPEAIVAAVNKLSRDGLDSESGGSTYTSMG